MTTLNNTNSRAKTMDMNLIPKKWGKPVLDIIELEAAQHGKAGHLQDGSQFHRSY